MPGTSDVEVLVVSYNSAAVLHACLASLDRVVPGVAVAIREHGSEPAAIAALDRLAADHSGPVRVERDPSNPGFGAGCNALARSATASHLLFLNPDAEIVTWPWLDAAPPVGAVTGPVMVGSGDPARHWGVRYRVRDEIARSWLRRRGPRPDGRGFVSGAALLVDRASFERVGGFDEGYFLFYEDIDLCLRLNDAGVRTSVDDRWTVRHAGAHSTSGRFGASLQWSYESALRFHRSRGGSLGAYRCYVVADSLLRAGVRAARRDRAGVRAYLALGRRAAREVLSDRSRPSRP